MQSHNARPQDRRVSRLAGVEEGRLEVKVKKEDWLILYDPETGLVKWILLKHLMSNEASELVEIRAVKPKSKKEKSK